VIEFLGALDVVAGVAATTFDLSARLTHAVVATNNQTTLGRSSKRKIRAWEWVRKVIDETNRRLAESARSRPEEPLRRESTRFNSKQASSRKDCHVL
jgi:hypothetical protein